MTNPLTALKDILYDLDAERAVLGACLATGGAVLPQIAFLNPDDFWMDVHRDIYRAMCHLHRNGGRVDLVLLLDGDRSELARVRGHSSIVQPARVVLSLDVPDPADPETRRLRIVKNNIGPLPEPLGMRITAQGVRFCGPPRVPVRLSDLDRAVQALLSILADGPRPAPEIRDRLGGLSIAWRTARRAKDKMGIVSRRTGDTWHWSQPESS